MNENSRSRAAALLLVLGPLALTLGDLLRRLVVPSGNPSGPAITQAVSDHQAAWLAAGLLNLAAAVLLAPAVLALLPARGARGARATAIGAAMVVVGAVASAAHTVAFYSPYALYGKASTPTSSITALENVSYPLLNVVIALFLIGMMVGSLVLFVGLRRARRVPIWSVVAAVVFVACGSSGGVIPGILGIVAALAAFVPAARSLVTPPQPTEPAAAQQVSLAG